MIFLLIKIACRAAEIADGIKENTTVLAIKLGNNKIGTTGATYIFGALTANKTLAFLEITHNKIGNKAGPSILSAIKVSCPHK